MTASGWEGKLFRPAPPSLWDRIWEPEGGGRYAITRFAILRLLGLVYFFAFLGFIEQGPALLGENGLTPAADLLARIENALGTAGTGFVRIPSLFWLSASDEYLVRVGYVGAALSLTVLLGYANALTLSLLWFLYLSIVNVGQDWYSFGWEIQLLETGFLAIFLSPLLDGRPFSRRPPPLLVIWLFRFLIFRIMLGAGLIKLRGDPCWRDLTCLVFHYETQPIPNPLSPVFHFMPLWFHKLGVVVNHVVELIVPCFVFGPRRARHLAGVVLVAFQAFLILSGNLSFLNWLTIVPALACFDDSFWPRRFGTRRGEALPYHRAQIVAATALFLLVAFLGVRPLMNLASSKQVMNTSFTRLHLVNTYGAFGSVGRERLELVIEGTDTPNLEQASWRAYELPCKPTDVDKRPCVASPYHYRLDWLLWFAAMSRPEVYPWSLHLVWKLLENDPLTLGLFAKNPFPDEPPCFVRVDLYRYRFAREGEAYYTREKLGAWLPPLSRDDDRLRDFLRSQNWLD